MRFGHQENKRRKIKCLERKSEHSRFSGAKEWTFAIEHMEKTDAAICHGRSPGASPSAHCPK
jgi:hypothetical protein